MRAVAYIRVSTNKEEQELSLEHQREFFEKYVAQRGDELLTIYSDKGKSATKMKNRRELQKLLLAAKRGEFEKLYIKDISRLSRNSLDFISVTREFAELGIHLHMVNMGEGKDIDKFTLNLMAMLAENESEKISERIKFGKKFSKEQGIVPNFVFGYDRIDKYTLVPNVEESQWVQKIFDLYTEEKWGMARIAAFLFKNTVKTKKSKDGNPNYNWSQNTVGQVLKNQIYIGKVINGKESMKSIYTTKRTENPEDKWFVTERPEFRIISDEQFQLAQKVIKENAEKFPTTTDGGAKDAPRRSDKHLFSNLIKCGCCGFSYRRSQRKYSENTEAKVWWTCSKRSAYGSDRCASEYIRIEEQWLKEGLSRMFDYLVQDKGSFFDLIEKKCNQVVRDYINNSVGFDIKDIEESLTELNLQRTRLKELAIKGLISMEEAENDMIPINKEIEKLNFSLNQVDKTRELTQAVKENLKLFFRNFNTFTFADKITNTDLKKIIKEIRVVSLDEIYVYFNVDDDINNIQFPIKLSGVFLSDTDTKNRT